MKIKIIQDKGIKIINRIFLNDKDITDRVININIDAGVENCTRVTLEFYPTELGLETEVETESKNKGYAIQEIQTGRYLSVHGCFTTLYEFVEVWKNKNDAMHEYNENYRAWACNIVEVETNSDKSKLKGYVIQEIATSKYIGHNGYTTKDIEKTTIWHHKEDAEQELKEKYNIHLFKVVGITV